MSDLDYVAESARAMAVRDTGDGDTPTTVTYRLWVSSTDNPETQILTHTYTDTATTALKHSVTTLDVEQSKGALQVGDVVWRIAGDNLSITATAQDIVVEGTDVDNDPQWHVMEAAIDVALALWRIATRKIAQ